MSGQGQPPNLNQHQQFQDDDAATNNAATTYATAATTTTNAPKTNATTGSTVFQPFQRARTPQMQLHPPGGSPGASHLQMHPHLHPQGQMQPRSPLIGSQPQAPGSVPAGNPATPQMMHQQMGMNQPMSLPPQHVSRPASVAPPSSVPANLHTSGGGPPSNQMDLMSGQSQYQMHLQPQQPSSRPGSQQSHNINSVHGGPQSIQQPGSIQRPGSVLAPGSIQPPGSQSQSAINGPPSHNTLVGPQSVQVYGPGSVQPPGSAQQPSSVQPAYGPASIQAPASQQAPSSIQPPPSAASSSAVALATAQNTKEPLKPNEEQIRMVQDPVDLVRNLVQKDLRNSIMEMNKRGAELVKQKEEGQMNDVDRAQYKRAANDFNSVCDEIDRTLTTVLETAKQLSKLDKVFVDRSSKEFDGELMVNCVQSFVDNTDVVQKMFDDTIGSVTASMEKMRRRQKKWEDLQKKQKNNENSEMTE